MDRLAAAPSYNPPATNEQNRIEEGEESTEKDWSRGRELNPRPTDYESVALPLSYPGNPA
jgi:hypothetical protein